MARVFQATEAKTKKSDEEVTSQTESLGEGEKKVKEDEEDDEEIPQLVPMETPSKKPKLQVSIIVSAWISFLMYSEWVLAETALWWNSTPAVLGL